MKITQSDTPLRILLADDDSDDRYFFDLVVNELSFPAKLTTVEDGSKLMSYLLKHAENLPDVLFLDLNMPRKNGYECLEEIKGNPKLKNLPVIIYSTSVHTTDADILYESGANFYIRKTDMVELKKMLEYTLRLMMETDFAKPERDNFIVTIKEIAAK